MAALGAAAACSNYVPPDVANYGPPNGLTGKTPAAPSGGGSSGGGGSGSSGSSSGGSSDDAGPGSQGAYCVTTLGQTLVTATTCSVSWSNDLYPKMQSGGAWNCASSACHGTSQAPVLTGTADSFYTTLESYTGTVSSGAGAGQPYINPCSTDPTKSEFVCNTQTMGFCGLAGMPLGLTITPAGLADIATWVGCGAPQN
jgi:hypothetical protein